MEQSNIFEIIRASLKGYKPRIIDDAVPGYAQASVLIPLLSMDGQNMVLFTRRTDKVEHHKGQISFPGGAVDKEDGSLEETAYREANEEIGLLKEDVEMLGRIDDELAVVSSFIIHPFAGRMPWPYDLKINRHEVDSLIFIPLHVFTEDRAGYKKDFVIVDGFAYHGTNYQYGGDVIWGATARIMENFVRIIKDKIMLA